MRSLISCRPSCASSSSRIAAAVSVRSGARRLHGSAASSRTRSSEAVADSVPDVVARRNSSSALSSTTAGRSIASSRPSVSRIRGPSRPADSRSSSMPLIALRSPPTCFSDGPASSSAPRRPSTRRTRAAARRTSASSQPPLPMLERTSNSARSGSITCPTALSQAASAASIFPAPASISAASSTPLSACSMSCTIREGDISPSGGTDESSRSNVAATRRTRRSSGCNPPPRLSTPPARGPASRGACSRSGASSRCSNGRNDASSRRVSASRGSVSCSSGPSTSSSASTRASIRGRPLSSSNVSRTCAGIGPRPCFRLTNAAAACSDRTDPDIRVPPTPPVSSSAREPASLPVSRRTASSASTSGTVSRLHARCRSAWVDAGTVATPPRSGRSHARRCSPVVTTHRPAPGIAYVPSIPSGPPSAGPVTSFPRAARARLSTSARAFSYSLRVSGSTNVTPPAVAPATPAPLPSPIPPSSAPSTIRRIIDLRESGPASLPHAARAGPAGRPRPGVPVAARWSRPGLAPPLPLPRPHGDAASHADSRRHQDNRQDPHGQGRVPPAARRRAADAPPSRRARPVASHPAAPTVYGSGNGSSTGGGTAVSPTSTASTAGGTGRRRAGRTARRPSNPPPAPGGTE